MSTSVYQFYAELKGYKPKMWRKFRTTGTITLSRFAYIIMTLYELKENHPFEFTIDELDNFLIKHPEYVKHPELLKNLNKTFNKLRYGIISKKDIYYYNIKQEEEYGKMQDATKIKIQNLFSYPSEKIQFYYDPEINWHIEITLENVKNDDIFIKRLPDVIDGEEFGIIESIIGTKQLEETRKQLEEQKWRNTIDYKFYYTRGDTKTLKLDRFDKDDMNYRLQKIPKILMDIYENKLYPSLQSERIVKRKYSVFVNNKRKYKIYKRHKK